MLRTLQRSALWAVTLLGAPAAMACPDCGTARLARAAVFDERFLLNLGVVLSPLLLLGLLGAALHAAERHDPREGP